MVEFARVEIRREILCELNETYRAPIGGLRSPSPDEGVGVGHDCT